MLLLVLLIINFPANLRLCNFGQPCEIQILQGLSPTKNRRLASLRKVWPHLFGSQHAVEPDNPDY